MSKLKQNILLLVALALFIAGANLYHKAWHGFYYQCYAVSILILVWVIDDLLKTIPSEILKWMALSNLLDEVLFKPTEVRISEYIVCAVVSILIIIKHLRNGRYKSGT